MGKNSALEKKGREPISYEKEISAEVPALDKRLSSEDFSRKERTSSSETHGRKREDAVNETQGGRREREAMLVMGKNLSTTEKSSVQLVGCAEG